MKSREKIVGMVAEGRIDEREGATLLDALDGPRTRRPLRNPLAWLPVAWIIGAGIVAVALGALISRGGIRFDGAFDLHLVNAPVSMTTTAIDALSALPVPALAMWICALAFAPKTRLIDVLGAVSLSRIPLTACAALLLLLPRPGAALSPGTLATVFVVLGAVAWQMTWLFQSFRTATGLSGGKLAGAFTIALIVAEVIGKVVVSALA